MASTQELVGPLRSLWLDAAAGLSGPVLAGPDDSLPVPPASDRATWDAAGGQADTATRDELRERAQADLGTPWPQLPATAYARYFRDGSRDDYEQACFARQQRLSRAAVVAASTLDPVWVDEVADGVILLCEQSTWCWPAHDDTFQVHGAVLPTVSDPFVDLGAGEVVGQLAWIDHLLGPVLDRLVPGLRARIRAEARLRVLEPFVRRRDWHWLGLDGDVHNWNPWIHGNVLVAALQLMDEGPARTRTVELVVDGLDRYVMALPADGAIDEGYAYWWNGACRALEALDILAHVTRGALVATTVPALRATVAFPHRMHLGGPWYLNLADGPARPPADQPWHALHRAATAVGDDDARRHAAAHRTPGGPVATEREGLGRLLRALTDDAWRAAAPYGPPLPRDVWLPSIQVLVARQTDGDARGLTLAVKGGHNGEHHNHNDVGSVVVALDGVPVVVDAGRPTYTAQTFGPDRYAIWTMQSSWHNVPEIRGTPQSPGHSFGARDVTIAIDDTGTALRADLAHAYDRPDLHRWWRTARLDRDLGRVTVRDEWHLDETETDGRTTITLLLAGQVDIGEVDVGEGTAVVTALGGVGRVAVRWDPAEADARLDVRELDDPMLTDVWGDRLTRLRLDVGQAATAALTVSMEVIR